MEETQARLTEEFSAVARDYCDISWGKALEATGIPADSGLRRPESIYYDKDIRELSNPSSSLPEQAAQVSEVPKADQVPPAPMEASTDSHQDAGKGKEAEALQGKDKGKDKKKDSSKPAEKDSWERLRHYYLSARASCWPRGSQGKSLGLALLSFVVFFLIIFTVFVSPFS